MQRKTILGILVLLVAAIASWSASAQEASHPPKEDFAVNPRFKKDGVPGPDKKLTLAASKKEVDKAFAELQNDIQKMCSDKMEVVRIKADQSTLKVTTFKNFSAPVPAKFTHFDGYVAWTKDKAEPQSELLIDATSWDSGVEARDHRVIHHLLKADQKKNAVVQVNMQYQGLNALQTGTKETKGEINFQGKSYEMKASSRTTKDGLNWTVKSASPVRWAAKVAKKDLLDIMRFCNHESLTSTVDLEWTLVLEPACK